MKMNFTKLITLRRFCSLDFVIILWYLYISLSFGLKRKIQRQMWLVFLIIHILPSFPSHFCFLTIYFLSRFVKIQPIKQKWKKKILIFSPFFMKKKCQVKCRNYVNLCPLEIFSWWAFPIIWFSHVPKCNADLPNVWLSTNIPPNLPKPPIIFYEMLNIARMILSFH